MGNRRLAWLVFIPIFGVIYELAFFWWVSAHSPTIPMPYVFGYTFMWSFEALLGPVCLVVLCLVAGRAPRARYVAALAFVAGLLGAICVAAYTGNGDVARFSVDAATYIPSFMAAFVVLLGYYGCNVYARSRQAKQVRGE